MNRLLCAKEEMADGGPAAAVALGKGSTIAVTAGRNIILSVPVTIYNLNMLCLDLVSLFF